MWQVGGLGCGSGCRRWVVWGVVAEVVGVAGEVVVMAGGWFGV